MFVSVLWMLVISWSVSKSNLLMTTTKVLKEIDSLFFILRYNQNFELKLSNRYNTTCDCSTFRMFYVFFPQHLVSRGFLPCLNRNYSANHSSVFTGVGTLGTMARVRLVKWFNSVDFLHSTMATGIPFWLRYRKESINLFKTNSILFSNSWNCVRPVITSSQCSEFEFDEWSKNSKVLPVLSYFIREHHAFAV
jgi:hypothetical protein